MLAGRVLALLLLALPSTPSRAEIYMCTGKGKLPVYQNFPCPFDRLVSTEGRDAVVSKADGKPASGTAAASPRPADAPRVGMTTREVQGIWGKPLNISKEEFAKKDVEVWLYSDSRSIEFDRKGVATAISW